MLNFVLQNLKIQCEFTPYSSSLDTLYNSTSNLIFAGVQCSIIDSDNKIVKKIKHFFK